MAREMSGPLNRFLNLIGLVDDGNPRDSYGDEYKGGNYGRQQPYTPSRRNTTQDRRGTTAGRDRSGSNRSTRVSGGGSRGVSNNDSRDRYGSRNGRYGGETSRTGTVRPPSGYDYYGGSGRRTASRFEEQDYSYDDPPRSRFGDAETNLPGRVRQRPTQIARRSRTVMYSLHSLEDCCEVIDQLIANNTVVLSMDDLDGAVMQRAVDTLSGAVFALHANIRKASQSSKTYLLAPDSVDIDDI